MREHAMYSSPHHSRTPARSRKTRKKARVLPPYVRAALVLLRRFAEREEGQAQRDAVTAWVDHLADMLEHPYSLNSRELHERAQRDGRAA